MCGPSSTLIDIYFKVSMQSFNEDDLVILSHLTTWRARMSYIIAYNTCKRKLTVNCEQRRVTEPLGRHVLGHACVVSRVLQSGLADQQVSLARHDHVVVRLDRHVVP